MAEKSFPLENTEYTAEDAQLWFAARTSGVYAGEHLGVSANGTMTVTLGSGIAWMHYATFAGIVYGNTADKALTVDMSDAQFNRVDRVCIRLEQLNNTCYAYVKKGTAATSPMPPALQRDNVAYEISVARIDVPVGATGIGAMHITDERLDASVCGLMTDGVTGIDTGVLHAQAEAFFEQLRAELQAVHDGIEKVNMIDRTATLTAVGWMGSDVPFVQTIAVNGLIASDKPFVDLDTSGATTANYEALAGNFALVGRMAAGAGNLTAYCYEDKPEIDLPIMIRVVR